MSIQINYIKNESNIDYEYLKMASILTIFKKRELYKNKPMLSLPFLDWFESYNFKDFNLIEFGSGNSTNYFAEKVKKVVSFETNLEFYNKTKNRLLENVDYRFIEEDDLKYKDLDIEINDKTIIFVDCATNRFLTTKNIFSVGFPNIFILDNSDIYKNTCNFIYKNNYLEIPFWGIKLAEIKESCTSIFIKNNFKMIERDYNYFSIGSMVSHNSEWDKEE